MPADAQFLDGWRMAGANPERTSWTPEEVAGKLSIEWYKPFEAHIPRKVQVIAAGNALFIATSRGLYALDADTGAEKWVYPTELPLGHSPTVVDGAVYFGCFDRRIHAVDAATGKRLWISEPANAGFQTNPLPAEGAIYAGCRDGRLYAFDAKTGATLWRFETELLQPILFSCAYRDGILFFAANDGHAYAVDAKTGTRVWKSAKLPGAGFHSWWPVVYRDRIIFTGSNNYREVPAGAGPGQFNPGKIHWLENTGIYGVCGENANTGWAGALADESVETPWRTEKPKGLTKSWADGPDNPLTLDLSRKSPEGNGTVTEYYKNHPWRRTYFVLRADTGEEVVYDFSGSGKPEYAPLLYHGPHSGNRFPPIIGGDDLLYQAAGTRGNPWICQGGIVRWLMDSPLVGTWERNGFATDEPNSYSAGGNYIYTFHSEGHDGFPYSFDIHSGTRFNHTRGHICHTAPDIKAWAADRPNNMYCTHGDQGPPIPFKGKIYLARWDNVIAFSQKGGMRRLEPAETAPAESTSVAPARAELARRLAAEVQKTIEAGHLRPGWHHTGLCGQRMYQATDDFGDYFSYPGDVIVTLARALPHLPEDMRGRARDYIKSEFEAYPPDKYAHIGWQGAAREAVDLPPEAAENILKFQPRESSESRPDEKHRDWPFWKFPPHANYALFQYAKLFGNAADLLPHAHSPRPPPDEELAAFPDVLNAYIAGFAGLAGLAKLAGEPDPEAQEELDRLIELRAATFTVDRPRSDARHGSIDLNKQARTIYGNYIVPLTAARNFMFMTPELVECLREHQPPPDAGERMLDLEDEIEIEAISSGEDRPDTPKLRELRFELSKLKLASTPALKRVENAWNEYNEHILPYWFVAKHEEGIGENAMRELYDYHAMFQARATILRAPYEELVKHLDVPAFYMGDLFYIDNLAAALEAAGTP